MTKKKKKPYNQKAIQEILRKRGITQAPLDDPIYNEPVTITFTNRRWRDPDSEEGKGHETKLQKGCQRTNEATG